jgi:SAM-dependent methyltransferase
MALITETALNEHINLLKEKVFQVETRWPHFRQLIKSIKAISEGLDSKTTVVSLERGVLYGGYSLIAPMFHKHDFISVDCSPASAEKRGSYNSELVNDSRFIKIESNKRCQLNELDLKDNVADLVIVPNLVHHVADQDLLFKEFLRITKPGGNIFIFEPILRELHQMPDDYIRYTPFGMKKTLEKHGFVIDKYELEGGPFSAIAYCWDQALQYFPEDKRNEMEKWFYEDEFPKLINWDNIYKENLVRKHTKFPVSFCMFAHKALP